MKRMDFFAGQGARRRHSSHYGDDEQRCHAEKDAVSFVPLFAKQTTSVPRSVDCFREALINPSTVRPEVSKGRYFLSVSVSLVLLYISTNGVNQSFPRSPNQLDNAREKTE